MSFITYWGFCIQSKRTLGSSFTQRTSEGHLKRTWLQSEFLAFHITYQRLLSLIFSPQMILIYPKLQDISGFPGDSAVKNLPANAGDESSIPGLRRSPGEGNGNSLQYSCLENPMDQGVWQATVHGVGKSQTWQNMVHNKCTSNIKNIEINKVISSCPTLDLNLFTEYLLCARP